MSTIIVAGIVITAVAGISFFLIFISNKAARKKTQALLARFHQSGTENNLSFSGQELLTNCIIGLDGLQRKLLIVKHAEGTYDSRLIHLDNVKSCGVTKQQNSTQTGDLKKKAAEAHVEKIVLRFELDNAHLPVEIPFYEHIENNIFEMRGKEQKARNWEAVLSKMLNRKLKRSGNVTGYESEHWQGY